MSLEDDYEFVVAIRESLTYLGAGLLEGGIRILCGPCTHNEAMRFVEEAVKDGASRDHYILFTRKIEKWKECT